MDGEWEGGRRQGVRWRAVALLVVCAVLAGGWWWLAGRDDGLPVETVDEPIPGATETPQAVVTAPRRAGDRWFCPNDFPVPVDEAGVYYPVNYPRRTQELRPAACFADARRAAEAGHRLAEPPAGAVVAGDLYVVPANHPRREACLDLAADAGFAVPCPTLLPAPAFGPTCSEARCRFGDGVVIEQRSFFVADTWCVSCPARVVITAVDARGPRELVRCGPGERIGRLPSRPGPRFDTCPRGPGWIPGIGGYPHESNPVYRWRRRGVTYAASVEGDAGPAPSVRAVLDAVVGGLEHVASR